MTDDVDGVDPGDLEGRCDIERELRRHMSSQVTAPVEPGGPLRPLEALGRLSVDGMSQHPSNLETAPVEPGGPLRPPPERKPDLYVQVTVCRRLLYPVPVFLE